MSRGVVLWPDAVTGGLITGIWEKMTSHGVPSLATYTHQRHKPHVSIAVAERLPVQDALRAVGPVPSTPIKLLIEAAGVFPGGLVLACVPNRDLLDEQRRVHRAISGLMTDPWPHLQPGAWTPHITLGRALTAEQLARALPLVLNHLPIEGQLDHGGVEDGTTGENWPARTGPTPPDSSPGPPAPSRMHETPST